MALKDWKAKIESEEYNDRKYYIWQNYKINLVIVMRQFKINNKLMWVVKVQRMNVGVGTTYPCPTMQFKTKQQALKFAKAYMRKH